ncbi:MAG: PDZ domain-containing protein [Candidatus Cloacimonetes bacterium]|nr:PDZ domain-containing protein [Candidatus Cloacimonadota bacterium]
MLKSMINPDLSGKKCILLLLAVMVLGSVSLYAQEKLEENEINIEIQEELDEAMEEMNEALKEINIKPITININKTSSKTPKMGVYLADMDFEDAYKMHYPHCYGVLVKGITTNGPAQKAGIIGGDIIMEFDGKKVKFEDHLVNLIKSKNIGDEVEVKLYRDEETYLTKLTLSTLKHVGKDIVITKDGKKKKKLSVGFGGGSWIPVWYVAKDEFEDINFVLNEYGFNGLDEKGIFMNGGGGKGNVGKGWFLGGMGAGYSIDRKKGYLIGDSLNVTRRMYYSNGFGGVTLDKRFAVSKRIVTSLGFMLGWGGHTLEVSQTDSNYNWDSLNDDMDASANNFIEMKRSYIIFQPKAMLMVRILDWLGIRAEAGYFLSHSFTSGWESISCGDDFEIANSPDTSYDGYTISIGPWFGF